MILNFTLDIGGGGDLKHRLGVGHLWQLLYFLWKATNENTFLHILIAVRQGETLHKF